MNRFWSPGGGPGRPREGSETVRRLLVFILSGRCIHVLAKAHITQLQVESIVILNYPR